ncbi:Uncharacterised protein [Mycobacteroides abscessus subsp. abscessus]|nr:Uncharacterised protein [Mycobacteroides abscessus subsp. abscessus]
MDCRATHTTDTCGLPSGLMVTSVASAPAPIRARAASLSSMSVFYSVACGFIPDRRSLAG